MINLLFTSKWQTNKNRVSNYSSAFFLTIRAGTAYRRLFHVAGTDVEMCKLFNLKKTLYESSTVARIAKRFELNTVLWAVQIIQPFNYSLY